MTEETVAPGPADVRDDEELTQFARDWYAALDRHDPIDQVLPYLIDDGLEMVFPETTKHGHAGFREWYDAVTHRFFDEEHTVTSVERQGDDPRRVTLEVVVNWQARIWDAPEPVSKWLGFDAYQTWQVVRDESGRPQVATYVVDELRAMPGSAPL